ncbi:MAG: peptidoglycan-associated lipoprotein Pal [Zoogloeaceae bacterium]|jgi:peptidoglycan-associated lipoprotein|nr:peptidoglycan-associated lipoprotein Pal [Zoogloeaceae bacterium]
MKSLLSLTSLTLAALFLLGGCGTTGNENTGGVPVETRSGGDSTIPEPVPPPATGLPRELTDPNSPLSRRSVYFALDQYNIAAEYRDLIVAHGKFLSANRQFKVLIQGNTDERGSREYNLSLGQKRAEAVRQQLLLLGVQEEQIEAVSLGEEKPRDEGHNEEAWAENRRADILYSGEF